MRTPFCSDTHTEHMLGTEANGPGVTARSTVYRWERRSSGCQVNWVKGFGFRGNQS